MRFLPGCCHCGTTYATVGFVGACGQDLSGYPIAVSVDGGPFATYAAPAMVPVGTSSTVEVRAAAPTFRYGATDQTFTIPRNGLSFSAVAPAAAAFACNGCNNPVARHLRYYSDYSVTGYPAIDLYYNGVAAGQQAPNYASADGSSTMYFKNALGGIGNKAGWEITEPGLSPQTGTVQPNARSTGPHAYNCPPVGCPTKDFIHDSPAATGQPPSVVQEVVPDCSSSYGGDYGSTTQASMASLPAARRAAMAAAPPAAPRPKDSPKQAPPGEFRMAATGKVRVGFLSPNLNSGGAESVQLQLIKGLDPAKFALAGMVVGDAMGLTDATATAATAACVPIQYGLSSVAALAAGCDVLVSWMVEDMARWLGGATTPYVFIDHFPHSAPLAPVAQYCLQGAAAVVGVSSLCSPAWTAAGWASRYSVIPNAVDTGRLAVTQTKAQMMARWGIAGTTTLGTTTHPPVAASYCRIHADRRPDAVIRSIAGLPASWHVVLIGEQNDPAELAYVKSLIAGLTAAQQARVHFLAEDPNSGNVLNAIDVLVSAPSGVTESFGLSAVEALWMGKAVVATPFGVANLYPRYFYPVALDDTPTNLAAAITSALALGPKAGGQAFVRQTYTQAAFINSWTTLLTRLAAPAAKSAARSYSDRELKILAAVETCPDSSCGCPAVGTRDCRRPDRPDRVTRAECYECKSGEVGP